MFVHPDDYALPGDNITSRINKMFEEAPEGSKCFIPAGITLTRTPGTNYYLRLRRDLSIVSNSSQRNPIFFDTSNGEADVLLIEPEAPDYVFLQPEISTLKFNPVGVNSLTYNPADPRCNYCRDVVRINVRAGFGIFKLWMHDCYLPFGTGYGLHVIGLPDNASVFSCHFDRIYTDGGIKLDQISDACTFFGCRTDGKMGVDYNIQTGAGELLFEQMQMSMHHGPAFYGRGGNKVTMRQVYIEQKGWDRPGLPKVVMDLRHDEITGTALMNALTLDGITVSNHTGQPMEQLIRIGKSLSPILRRINFYGVAECTNALKIDSDVTYPQLQGPFTFGGTFTGAKIDCPKETKPYGFSVQPSFWNTPFNLAVNKTGNNRFLKSADGTVTFSGVFVTDGATVLTNGVGVCGVPLGFGSVNETAFTIMSDTGPCQLIVSPADQFGNGVMSLEGLPPGCSRFRASCLWHNKDHLDGLETNN